MTTCYWIGDSYSGEAFSDGTIPAIVCAQLGWTLTLDWIGGSRYVGSTPSSADFGNRVTAAIAAHPDVAVIFGSVNDRWEASADATAAVAAALLQLRAAVPLVYAGMANGSDGIVAGYGWGPIALAAARDAVKAGAASVGVPFIDGVGWIYGTGRDGTPTGDGNADIYVDSAGVHHTALGIRYLGARLAFAIAHPNGTGNVGTANGLTLATESGSPIALGFQP